MREHPDRVILEMPPAVSAGDLIEVEQIGVLVLLQLVFQRLVKLFNKELEITQIIAPQQTAHRVLLRHQKVADESQYPVCPVPAHQLGKLVRQPVACRLEQPLAGAEIGRQTEDHLLGQDVPQRDLDQM